MADIKDSALAVTQTAETARDYVKHAGEHLREGYSPESPSGPAKDIGGPVM